jgi:oligogalacturonide lyase
MSSKPTETTQNRIRTRPSGKLRVDDLDRCGDGGELAVTRRALALSAALAFSVGLSVFAANAPAEPPSSWIDPDTGHRVIRLTREPDSVSFYFNDNGYTPNGRQMVYTTREGISVLDLVTLQTKQVVSGPARAVVVGRKTPTIYYTKRSEDRTHTTLWGTNVDTGECRKFADLPRRGGIYTINSDETLACGTYEESDPARPSRPTGGGNAPTGNASKNGKAASLGSSQNAIQADDKWEAMNRRLAAKIPLNVYLVDLRTGVSSVLLHTTDWIDHVQFSPTDPTRLIYAHEGHWQYVDRVWSIRTDGTQNLLLHRRTMEMESAGHEWWDADGKTVWYQLHYPGAMKTSFLASYDEDTGERRWYRYDGEAVSIHHNSSPDGKLFCGDGDSRRNPWIVLLRPKQVVDDRTVGTGLIKGGTFQVERLVNMSKHNYALEPNPTFTPDQKLVIFASNMFGPTYVFGVEVAKPKK